MNKVFSVLNGYEVKDANARNKNIEQDSRITATEEANKTAVSRINNLESTKLDKNINESVSWAMLGQDVKEQITGGNTAVVDENSVNTTNIIDGAVTYAKLSNTLRNQIAKASAEYVGDLQSLVKNATDNTVTITYDTGYVYTRLNESGQPVRIKIPGATKTLPNDSYLVVNLDDYTTYNQEIEPVIYTSSESQVALFNGNYIILFYVASTRFGGLMYDNYNQNIEMSNLSSDLKKTIVKGNPLLLGSILDVNVHPTTYNATVTIDRSYLYVQQNEQTTPYYISLANKTYEIPNMGFLVVKLSDLNIKGTEVTPTIIEPTFSRATLFNGDYIILLSNQYGRLGGLFAQNTFGLANQTDLTIDDTQVYLQVSSDSSITLLKKCSQGDNTYLGIDFTRMIDETKNCDIWRLLGIKRYTKTGSNFTPDNVYFSTLGEMEAAIYINGATDYVGGSIHGYETTKGLEIYIDGKLIDLNTSGVYSGKYITINRISEMYDYGTSNLFANHNCIYEFTNEGLVLNQNVEFKLSKTLKRSYLGMYPIARKVNDLYVSNKGVFFPTLENVDLYEEHTNHASRSNVNGILLTNQESSGYHFIGKLEVIEKNVPLLKLQVSNAEQYNKIYPIVCEDNHVVSVGDAWNIKSKYTFDYKGLTN